MAFHFYAETKCRSVSNLHILHSLILQWKMIMLILSGGRFNFFPYCFIMFTFSLRHSLFFVVGWGFFVVCFSLEQGINLTLSLMLRQYSSVFTLKHFSKRILPYVIVKVWTGGDRQRRYFILTYLPNGTHCWYLGGRQCSSIVQTYPPIKAMCCRQK